jgi:hypothetical protein
MVLCNKFDYFPQEEIVVKYIIPSLILVLAVAGIAVWLFADNLMLGLGMTAAALVLWAIAPSTLGQPGGSSGTTGKVDPQRVKDYRAENPGATIADGIRATRP